MTNSTSTSKTNEVKLTAAQSKIAKAVSALIIEGATLAASTVDVLKQAATLAVGMVKNVPALKTVSERAEFIAKVHAKDVALLANHEKQVFKDSLFLLLAPNEVIEVKPAKGNQGAVMMKAGEAMTKGISKHALRAAASDIRSNEGTGRASKGKAPAKPKAKADTLTPSLIAALPSIVANPKSLAELKAALSAIGYTLAATKATGKRAKPEVSSIAGMVTQINQIAENRLSA